MGVTILMHPVVGGDRDGGRKPDRDGGRSQGTLK